MKCRELPFHGQVMSTAKTETVEDITTKVYPTDSYDGAAYNYETYEETDLVPGSHGHVVSGGPGAETRTDIGLGLGFRRELDLSPVPGLDKIDSVVTHNMTQVSVFLRILCTFNAYFASRSL